ncbi:hypothetical protein AAG570_004008 [Ranatra chinensis]|uniref:Serum response factor-binding protein 1 n=1 Tax=Ranatra chinensis TaxID=642074 RepID=A0ABD0YF49_9HEMI
MEPLSQSSFNNYVVAMRQNVRRARVQTIHKLTKVIKRLREKKGSEEQKQKNSAKADRLAEEILVMHALFDWCVKIVHELDLYLSIFVVFTDFVRCGYVKAMSDVTSEAKNDVQTKNDAQSRRCRLKMKDDEIAKECLQNTRKPEELIADVNSSVGTRAWARLSIHKSLSDPIAKFHVMYPDWRETVPMLLNLTKKERKKLLAKKIRKINKESRRKSTIKRPDFLDQPIQEVDGRISGTGREIIKSKGNTFIVEEVMTAEKLKVEEKMPKVEKKNKLDRLETEKKVVNNFNSNKLPVVNSQKEPSPPTSLKDEKLDSDSSSIQSDKETSWENGETELKPLVEEKHVDPFFVTSDNKEYLSYVVPVEIEDVVPDRPKQRPSDEWKNNKQKFNRPRPGGEQFFKMRKSTERSNQFDKADRFERKRGLQTDFRKTQRQSENIKEENLHPSWQAKKKFSTLPSFQGKKVTFD